MKLAFQHTLRAYLLCVFFVLVVAPLSAASSSAAELANITIGKSQGANGQVYSQIEVQMSEITAQAPHVFFISGDTPRIVVDFKNTGLSTKLQTQAGRRAYFDGGLVVEKVRYARRGQHDFRLVADLVPMGKYVSHTYSKGVLRIFIGGGSHAASLQQAVEADTGTAPIPRLNPRLHSADDTFQFKIPQLVAASIKTPVIAQPASQVQPAIDIDAVPVPRLKRSRRVKYMKKPLIVIDPGHGGHDPGAIGSGKTYEDVVTLKAGLELRRQLLASGRYKVVMTRSTDTYIAHDKRVLIARKAGADLFISIHADSTHNSIVRGASVYTLAVRAEGRTHRMVSHHNWVANVDLSQKSAPVSNILVDLAQRKTLSQSGKFADILLMNLKPTTMLVGNSHRRAGYYVLLAPDVPAVLLEMGFLSNPQDEKLLKSAQHRKKLMASVKRAIDQYF